MRTVYNRYAAIFHIPFAENLAYIGNWVSATLSMAMFMWIFGMLWQTVFTFQGVDRIAGLTLNDTLWYLLLAELVVLSKPLLAVMIAESIQNGAIAYDLVRPYHFSLYHLSRYAGHVVFRASVNLMAGGTVVWLLVGPPPTWMGVVPALIALGLAWGLEFCFEALMGLLAFWVEDIFALRWIYQKASFILGGLFMPLEFYPTWLARLARLLPFASILYAPGRLFIHPEPDSMATTFMLQMVWLVILGILFQLLSRHAHRRLTINGG